MNRSCSDTEIEEALDLYQNSNLSSQEIADRFEISTGTLTAWAKSAQVKLRGRGRRRYDEPTVRQREVLRLVEDLGCLRTGKRLGISKQAVYNIVKRWSGWEPPKGPQPSDVILLRDRKMVVISNDGKGGHAWDYKTGKPFRITSWVIGGKAPKKVGVDTNIYPPVNGKPNGRKPQARKK